jgi:hypothetical protein
VSHARAVAGTSLSPFNFQENSYQSSLSIRAFHNARLMPEVECVWKYAVLQCVKLKDAAGRTKRRRKSPTGAADDDGESIPSDSPSPFSDEQLRVARLNILSY